MDLVKMTPERRRRDDCHFLHHLFIYAEWALSDCQTLTK